VILEYLASARFSQKKPRTQAEYRRVLEGIASEHGHKPIARLEPRHIYAMQDALQNKPGAANTLVRMMRLLLSFARKRGYITTNPASEIELLTVGEWRAWTDDECAAFEKRWPQGSMQRRAYALALYTGQRLSDLIAMTRAHRANGEIHVLAQSKTGEEMWIPEHRELTAELARGVAGIEHLLTTPTQGKSFDAVYFGAWFADAISAAGLPDDCVLHGLRKCAARKMADAGVPTEQIKAITGHKTDQMVAHYTKAADKRRRAKAAIRRWENSK
jgi:integrase